MKKAKSKIRNLLPGMGALAAASGIPLEIIRAAKAAGCPAFRSNGSVAVDSFMAWIRKNPLEAPPKEEAAFIPKAQAELRKILADAEMRETRLRILKRELIQVEDAKRILGRIILQAKAAAFGRLGGLALKISAKVGGDPSAIEGLLREDWSVIFSALSRGGINGVCPHCNASVASLEADLKKEN